VVWVGRCAVGYKWKYLLALDLADADFGHSLLCEFRGRLLQHAASERLLTRILDAACDQGLLKARGRQRTDSIHVLAAVRDLAYPALSDLRLVQLAPDLQPIPVSVVALPLRTRLSLQLLFHIVIEFDINPARQ
jgi:hypothetical protein